MTLFCFDKTILITTSSKLCYRCQPKVIEVGQNYGDDDHDHDIVWDMLADSVALDTRVLFYDGSENMIGCSIKLKKSYFKL